MNKKWRKKLSFTESPHFKRLEESIKPDSIPHKSLVFRAYDLTHPQDVKVVIVGDEPYQEHRYSNGLAFSISPHLKNIPRPLQAIFKEYCSDLGYQRPRSGDLSSWAHEGVLLINSRLTFNSRNVGWEKLTYSVLKWINENKTNVCFVFLGKDAKEYKSLVDRDKHFVFTSEYPLPKKDCEFLGSKMFSKINEYLKLHNLKQINWRLR